MTETTRKKKTTKKTTGGTSLVQVPAGIDVKKLFIALAVVLAVLIAALVYVLVALNKTANTAAGYQQTVTEQLNGLETQLKAMQQQVSGLEADDNRLTQSQRALEEALQSLQKQRPDTDQDWTLREAEYLVRVAMHRLHLERDIDTAMTALKTADQRLRDLSNPALIPLREQLAGDINALSTVEQPDVEGMAAELVELGNRIETLPLKNIIDNESVNPAAMETAQQDIPGQDGWRAIPSRIWQVLKSLVVIKRSDDGAAAFIMPNEEYYLQQNLKLELGSARIALLRHDTATFRAALDKVTRWLQAYYNTDAVAVKNTVTALKRMRDADLRPELPDLGRSLGAVRDFTANP